MASSANTSSAWEMPVKRHMESRNSFTKGLSLLGESGLVEEGQEAEHFYHGDNYHKAPDGRAVQEGAHSPSSSEACSFKSRANRTIQARARTGTRRQGRRLNIGHQEKIAEAGLAPAPVRS